MEQLVNLYSSWAGEEPASVVKLPAQGSNRQYFRFVKQDGSSVIGVIGTSRDENHSFIYMSRHFTLRKLPVPKVLAVSDDELAARKAAYDQPEPNIRSGWLARYARLVTSANLGAVLK